MNDIDINKLSECIVIGKYISEQCGNKNPSYEQLYKLGRKLKLEPYEVQAFYKFYKHIQTMMII